MSKTSTFTPYYITVTSGITIYDRRRDIPKGLPYYTGGSHSILRFQPIEETWDEWSEDSNAPEFDSGQDSASDVGPTTGFAPDDGPDPATLVVQTGTVVTIDARASRLHGERAAVVQRDDWYAPQPIERPNMLQRLTDRLFPRTKETVGSRLTGVPDLDIYQTEANVDLVQREAHPMDRSVQLHDSLQSEFVADSLNLGVDPKFYEFICSLAFLSGRSELHLRELKTRVQQYLDREYHEKTPEFRASYLARALVAFSTGTYMDRMFTRLMRTEKYFTVDGAYTMLHRVHGLSRGVIPKQGTPLERFFTRGKRLPRQ